ncbi:disease resistance protein Roq1-like [Humulus lupulus]|nr:disease resistance protein Roq1-like [Humulus lupulus]
MDDDDNQLSILTSRKKYAVFISFRGEDTRSSFTSHLYKALISNGIETYIDDRLERGDQISKALLHAIDDSRFSLVIFSKNYASSSWCLDELVHIIKRMEKKKQIVLPVFYHVDPSDVRSQKGSYADAFVKRKKSYSDSIIQQWRRALTTASNLSGWHVSNTRFSFSNFTSTTVIHCNISINTPLLGANISRNDAELVDEIVNYIRGKLRYTSSSTSNLKQGLVGIDKSIQDLCRLLSNAPIVGICGMGGLGKTTLAEVVFEQFRHQFDGHCFLRNVKEVVKKHGSTYLAQEFFGRLLSNKGKYIDLEDLDIEKERLYHKKLLIVLDDIENISEHDSLLRDSRVWLNSESKVIITSRNLQVLRNIIGDDEKLIYNLKLLDEDEALELFYLHALKKNKIARESCTEISRELVNYAQGLPLALIVLGRHLYSKREEVWQSLLMKLKVEPDESFLQVLKMSFDGLDVKEKNIFLDIACFFRGEKKYYVKEILDDCGCFDIVIEVLVDKCLITICEGRLQMHDLLKEMGWSIARGLNNRLWIAKDICHVLRSNSDQDVKTLKYVILSHSKKLTCLPDLSQANLQLLRLHGCTSLLELPPIRFHNAHDIINAENESEVMYKYHNLMLQLINYMKLMMMNPLLNAQNLEN